jgi:HEPN domain-containing protein
MKDETRAWLNYAAENLAVAELSLAHDHLNACLHNTQQAVEKYLKALIIEHELSFKKTHAIFVLWQSLVDNGFNTALTEEDCVLLDSVFMPSRYPLFSILPDAMPDRETCEKCIRIARRVGETIRSATKES